MAQNSKILYIKWFLAVLIACIPFLFPASEIYSVQMKTFLAITLFGIMLLAFELLHNVAVAFLMTILWILSGVCTYELAFSAWTTSNLWIAITAMSMVMIVQNTGLLNRIGYWTIIKAKASFTGIIIGLFFTSLIVTIVGFNMATVLCFAFAYALYKSLNLKPTDRETMIVILTVILGAVQSGVYTYCPITVALINGSASAVIPEFNITWYQLIFYNFPVLFISLATLGLALFWYKHGEKNPSISAENAIVHFKNEYNKMGEFSANEKKAAILLVIIAIYLMTQPWHGLDASYIYFVAVILSFMPGINIADYNCIKNVPWDNVFIIGTFLAVGTIGATLGLSNLIITTVVPVISGMGEYWSVLGTTILSGLANFVLSPFAMLAVLPGPIAQYSLGSGFEPMAHIMALYNAKDLIFIPYEYPTYLMLYSFGMIGMKNMIKVCCYKSFLALIGVIIVLMPFWSLIGIL